MVVLHEESWQVIVPSLTINISLELLERLEDWSRYFNRPAQELAVELLEEYFDDCDDADRLEGLIRSVAMETYPAEMVLSRLDCD